MLDSGSMRSGARNPSTTLTRKALARRQSTRSMLSILPHKTLTTGVYKAGFANPKRKPPMKKAVLRPACYENGSIGH